MWYILKITCTFNFNYQHLCVVLLTAVKPSSSSSSYREIDIPLLIFFAIVIVSRAFTARGGTAGGAAGSRRMKLPVIGDLDLFFP